VYCYLNIRHSKTVNRSAILTCYMASNLILDMLHIMFIIRDTQIQLLISITKQFRYAIAIWDPINIFTDTSRLGLNALNFRPEIPVPTTEHWGSYAFRYNDVLITFGLPNSTMVCGSTAPHAVRHSTHPRLSMWKQDYVILLNAFIASRKAQ